MGGPSAPAKHGGRRCASGRVAHTSACRGSVTGRRGPSCPDSAGSGVSPRRWVKAKGARPGSRSQRFERVHCGFMLAVVCPCIDRHPQCQHVPEGSGVCENPYPPDRAVPSEPSSRPGSVGVGVGVGTRLVAQASPGSGGCAVVDGSLVLRLLTQGCRAPSQPTPFSFMSPLGVRGSAPPAPSLPHETPRGLSPAPPPTTVVLLPGHLCLVWAPCRPPVTVLRLSASTREPEGSVPVSDAVQPLVVPAGPQVECLGAGSAGTQPGPCGGGSRACAPVCCPQSLLLPGPQVLPRGAPHARRSVLSAGSLPLASVLRRTTNVSGRRHGGLGANWPLLRSRASARVETAALS